MLIVHLTITEIGVELVGYLRRVKLYLVPVNESFLLTNNEEAADKSSNDQANNALRESFLSSYLLE